MLLANDTRVSIAASRDIGQHRAQYGEDPLWSNVMFCGMPAYLTNTRYDSNFFERINKVFEIGQRPASLFIIGMVSFWILMLVFGVNPWLAVVGAIAYGFSTNYAVLAAAGHISKIHTLAYA